MGTASRGNIGEDHDRGVRANRYAADTTRLSRDLVGGGGSVARSASRDAADAAQQRALSVAPVERRSRYERFVKPVLDRVGGAVLTIVTLPITALVALAILLTMGRPVIFRQPRVGRGGEIFNVMKFRTMSEDRRKSGVPFVGPDRRATHKSPDDPRLTGLGRFLRRWSLDEIPQFWNVVAGQMSLVGPRPELVHIVERYEPWQHRRHLVKPGITGLWQTSLRGEVPMHEASDIDIEYVDTTSLLLDLKLLLLTVPTVLGLRKGF